jgi:hypothetical protein
MVRIFIVMARLLVRTTIVLPVIVMTLDVRNVVIVLLAMRGDAMKQHAKRGVKT